ncbi:S41 family peptidase [Pseudidiomarina taiwanensis]|uniref:Peptidase S41 n=1 Tax=Pseudidiomarina taiwanensis TaxID=337250 RepID=A0A432ZCA3_9GAMM|nr:S41 family peptidase [Pseudidiomarina taiwanensis]RUO75539.1 peptidase S41 [Pseudidiomarina taiwanensis]
MNISTRALLTIALATALTGCGGGGSSGSSSGGTPPIQQCSISDQKTRFLSYMRDDYFWVQDLPSTVNLDNYADMYQLLEGIRSSQDRFSFILTEQEYQDRYVNASYAGFGFSARVTSSNQVFVNYVFADSPADLAGIQRADELVAIDGVAVTTLVQSGLYSDALGPGDVGVARQLTWRKPSGQQFTDVLTKEDVETNTVLAHDVLSIDSKQVGYFVLNSFINRTGQDLNSAYDTFNGVDELIIDVRYNGGGLTRFANQAASQAAGDNVLGRVFTNYVFNQNNQNNNFTEFFQLYEGVRQLDLNRVYVLTTGASCSSSELIINALKPFVDVVVIGSPTCGKPVGQIPELICDKRTFVVNFETVNANGEGGYFDGLPVNCSASDTLVGDWGDPNDPLLATAAQHITNGACPVAIAPEQMLTETAESTWQRGPRLIDQWRTEY